MKLSRMMGCLAFAALTAGCGTVASPATSNVASSVATSAAAVPSDVAAVISAPSDEFGLLSLGYGCLVPIATVCASSTFNCFFPPCHVNDCNSHTAWQPLCNDPCPMLTLKTCQPACLTSLTIKESGACTAMDVWAWEKGCWEQVACGLQPTPACMTNFCLPNVYTDQLELKFHDKGRDNLYVCEVDLYGTKSGPVVIQPTAN